MKKPLLFLGALLFAVILLFSYKNIVSKPSSPVPVALIKLRVGYIVNAAARPEIAVAAKEKLFEKYGLNVEINQFESGDVIVQGLVGGKVDVTLIGQVSHLKAAAAGAKIKSVGVVNSNTRWYFISRKPFSEIETYCTVGRTTEDFLRGSRELKKQGIDINTLNIINVASIPLCAKALFAGSVDSLAMTELAWENFKMQNEDAKNYKVIKKLFGEGYLTTPAVIMVMEDTLASKKEAIENFSKAMIEANYWLKTHSEVEIEKEIVGLVKITPTDAKIYAKVIKGQLDGVKFTQDLSNLEILRKTNEEASPKLKDYDVKNFLSPVISDSLTKQGFLQKYGF